MANSQTDRGKFKGREVAITLFVTAVIIALSVYYGTKPDLEKHQLEGKEAPQIHYQMEAGSMTSIRDRKGSAVLLNFWASWCRPCLDEMPSLRMLEQHFAGKGLVVLAFNLENEGEKVKGRVTGVKMPQHLIFNFSKEALRPYQVNSLPQSVLVDRYGIIRKVYSGGRDWMDLATIKEIEAALKP